MLEAARLAAEEALADRALILVDPGAYTAFLDRLEKPPQPNERLRATMRTEPPWEGCVRLGAPELLRPDHEIAHFDSGAASLYDWLKRRAQGNQASAASRTFVACSEGGRVGAYYALASSAVAIGSARGRFRRNMPDPIPVLVLARLAVDQTWQGQGIGRALVRDAVLRVIQAAVTIGIRGLIVHALSPDAGAIL